MSITNHSVNLISEELHELNSKLKENTTGKLLLKDVFSPDMKLLGMIPPSLLDTLSAIKKIYDSMIFRDIFERIKKEYAKNRNQDRTMSSIMEMVFQRAYAEFNTLQNQTSTGEITFKKIEQVFRQYHESSVRQPQLKRELSLLCPEEILNERHAQIEHYFKLREIREVAGILLKLQRMYKLEGDFKVIENIKKQVNIYIYTPV